VKAASSRNASFWLMTAAFLAMLTLAGVGTSMAADDGNLIVNTELKSANGGLPRGWTVHTIPDCSFRFEVHPDPSGTNDLRMINDAPIESIFEQQVKLKPGWYSFTAQIKIESIGSEGPAPELFVKATSFAVEHRVHPLEWNDDWQQYHAVFRAGERVNDFMVGCALGHWGEPNSGRFLFRNPVLVPTNDPQASKSGSLEVEKGYDVEGTVENRYFGYLKEVAKATAPVPVEQESSVLNKRWTVIALNLGLLVFAGLGWWAVSPR